MGQEIRISYTGDGFLYHMVRILTGTLVEVGLGLRKPEEMTEILEGQDRTKAGRLMPPEWTDAGERGILDIWVIFVSPIIV